MQLNPEGRSRFQAHLQNVMRQPCAVCGSGNWQIEDAIFELREFAGGALAAGGAVKPVVSMTCTGCGHIMFMSPITTGIIQMESAKASAAEAPASETIQ